MKNINDSYTDIHKDLIDGCRRFDQRSQFQIYKLYYKAMYNTCLRIVKDPMEAEDIMQESFLSAFEKIDTFSGTVSFGAWLKKIVENRSLDFLKKRRPVFEELKETRLYNTSETESFQDEIGAKVEKIREIIQSMPSGYRTVLSLNLLEGYDHNEIGEILGIDPNSSRSQFSRARRILVGKLRGFALFFQV
jgi:RNA polymerase sigma factor (sigma-70 family)